MPVGPNESKLGKSVEPCRIPSPNFTLKRIASTREAFRVKCICEDAPLLSANGRHVLDLRHYGCPRKRKLSCLVCEHLAFLLIHTFTLQHDAEGASDEIHIPQGASCTHIRSQAPRGSRSSHRCPRTPARAMSAPKGADV
jgi:hypothetical protein